MHNDIKEKLFSQAEIERKIKELGRQITHDYKEGSLVLISILKGGVVFLADLMREIDLPLEIEFLGVESYGDSTKSSGVVQITKDCKIDLSAKDVLIVEDIMDTGLSLQYIIEILEKKNPRSLAICVLLDKVEAHQKDLQVEYSCFEIPNKFVVGYGLDYAEKYRNLPYIGILREEKYR